MKKFMQFMRENEESFDTDERLLVLLKMAAKDHKSQVLDFIEDLSISDHSLRNKLEAYKEKSNKIPSFSSKFDKDDIVPPPADNGGGNEEIN